MKDLVEQRSANFRAMKSSASITLGISSIVLVVIVSAFYPVMQTPDAGAGV